MKSKYCPYKNVCCNSGQCQDCDHYHKYGRMAAKIKRLEKKNRMLVEENKSLISIGVDAGLFGRKAKKHEL